MSEKINAAIENLKSLLVTENAVTTDWTIANAECVAGNYDHAVSTRTGGRNLVQVLTELIRKAQDAGARIDPATAVMVAGTWMASPGNGNAKFVVLCWNDWDHVYSMPDPSAPLHKIMRAADKADRDRKALGLTENQELVIREFIRNDHVGDMGWDDPSSAAWNDILADDCKRAGLKGKAYSGTISKMLQDGLLKAGCPESTALTDKGRAAAKRVIESDSSLAKYNY